MKKITFSILFVWLSLSLWAARQPEFSTAGFFRLDNSGREVYSMNPAWRFHKGAVEGAETKEFNDKDWTVVSLPDGIEYLPTEASGLYQLPRGGLVSQAFYARCRSEREETFSAFRGHYGQK